MGKVGTFLGAREKNLLCVRFLVFCSSSHISKRSLLRAVYAHHSVVDRKRRDFVSKS